MKKLTVSALIAMSMLAGCKSIDVTREEFAPDGKTVTKRTSASVLSFAMATELEFITITGLGTAKNYKTDGGEATIKAAVEGAVEAGVKAGMKAVIP